MPHLVNSDACIGCEACVDECPTDAISMNGEAAIVDAEVCIDCCACEAVCPEDCIAEK